MAEHFTPEEVDQFMQGYLSCALWTSTDGEDGHLDDSFSVEDFSIEARAQAREECEDFMDANQADVREFAERASGFNGAGHDFWLSRNNYGPGFWDRGLDELGDRLDKAAEVYGSKNAYAGDDDRVYFM